MPTQDHNIPLDDAVKMTGDYRANLNTILKEDYQDREILAICETFDKDIFKSFLENDECKSVRIYYGMDEDLKVHAILVGVNADDEDMLPTSTVDAPLYENGARCPQVCPPASLLNS